MRMCQLTSDHRGRHIPRRNPSTYMTGAPMQEYRHASKKESLLRGSTSVGSFLFPYPLRIAAWARWACPDRLELSTAMMTLVFCDSLVAWSHSRLITISISGEPRSRSEN